MLPDLNPAVQGRAVPGSEAGALRERTAPTRSIGARGKCNFTESLLKLVSNLLMFLKKNFHFCKM
ncbi:MAG: hypothetical protein D6814_15905 [Calditrichaeota bacterium]|nr:MAG: hypothetical protein D6814_15905 [Calditrichota bacterium]